MVLKRATSKNNYQKPEQMPDVNECSFYHAIDLPGYGLMKGLWDLREGLDSYIGHINVRNKSFFDIGTANGFICFEMEKRGSAVTAWDLSENDDADIVPWEAKTDNHTMRQRTINIKKNNNAFWLSHNLFHSHAKLFYGSVYTIPSDLGPFDISFFGCILLHLRDPFLALQKAAAITKETIIVTDVVSPGFIFYDQTLKSKIKSKMQIAVHHLNEYFGFKPIIFAPNPKTKQNDYIWWYFSPKTIATYLKVLGFDQTSISYHYQKFLLNDSHMFLYTVVAKKS